MLAKSSAEAEYRAINTVTCEVIWINKILYELNVKVSLPVPIHCDNSYVIQIAANPVFHEKTKHFEIELFFLREKGENSNASVHKAVDSGMGKVDKGKRIMMEDTNVFPNKVDKGKWIMIEDTNVVPNRKAGRMNNGIVIVENVNPSVNESDSDSDKENMFNASIDVDSESEYSDKYVDFLSEAEEELIELRKKNGDDGMTDPFQIFETKNEEYPIHDKDTHWKMRKPKVGERTSKNQVIARCGLRPEKLKEPEKGKQSETITEEHYVMIRSYGKEILNSNEGFTMKLGMETGNRLTLMSDQHKGMIEAVKNVMPLADVDSVLDTSMKALESSIVEFGSNYEVVENGFRKCFNSVLLMVRNKPLITMLEAINDWNLQKINKARGNNFEERNGSEACRVNKKNRSCTCRMWQLSGLSCPRAIAIIFKLNRRPKDYVPLVLEKLRLDENVRDRSSASMQGGAVSGGTVRGGVVRGGRGRGGVVRGRGG
ncbi:pentatricopeptide repeat-containing protein [Tanacetum coccineum]